MRILIYARVSLDALGQGRSVAEQETECRAWADREGWEVVEVIAETGSASRYGRSTQARQRWDEVADATASGRIDALLTWEACPKSGVLQLVPSEHMITIRRNK